MNLQHTQPHRYPHTQAHLPSAPLHSGFSCQLSHSAGSDMKADQIQLALPLEMIPLIGISSGAGNTQHLLASASASWVTVRRGEQTVPGSLFVPFLILYGTCYVRHLDWVPPDCVVSGPEGRPIRHTCLLWRHINHDIIHLICSLLWFPVIIVSLLNRSRKRRMNYKQKNSSIFSTTMKFKNLSTTIWWDYLLDN